MVRIALSVALLFVLAPPTAAQEPATPQTPIDRIRAAADFARRVAEEGDSTGAVLAWLDVMHAAEEVLAANPWDEVGLAAFAEAAEGAGEPGPAADARLRLVLTAPGDAGRHRAAGLALLAADRTGEAVEEFRTAEAIAGPDAETLLGRAQAHDALGQGKEAIEVAARLFRLEADADRAASPAAREALGILWGAGRRHGLLERLDPLFAGWCDRYPALTSPACYLGHVRLALARSVRAAEAFRLLTERAPSWAEGWRLLAGSLLDAGRPADAADALGRAVALGPQGEENEVLLLGIAGALADAGAAPDALAVLDRFRESAGESFAARRVRADLLLRSGRAEEAARLLAALAAEEPGDRDLAVRLQKAVVALGAAPADAAEAPGESRTIEDFEEPQVLVRVSRGATGRRVAGAFRLTRREDRGVLPANLQVLLLPEIDSRPLAAVRFDVRGPAGRFVMVGAKDKWDDYDLELPQMNRFWHETVVALSGEWQTVTLPLDGFFAPGGDGPVRLAREGLRGITFELRPRPELAPEIDVDNVALVAADGFVRTLADFAEDPEERITSFEGPANPLQSVPRYGRAAEFFPPDSTTFVNPHIFGPEFEEGMVHTGRGAVRVAGSTMMAPEDQLPAALRLAFYPAVDLSRARSLVFWARGGVGGERLEVRIADTTDEEIGSTGTVAGRFVLTADWQPFRVRLAGCPALDRENVRALRFVIGGELNDKTARIYLDDVGTE